MREQASNVHNQGPRRKPAGPDGVGVEALRSTHYGITYIRVGIGVFSESIGSDKGRPD